MNSDTGRADTPRSGQARLGRLDGAQRRAGRVLCWTHAVAMLTAAAQAVLSPDFTGWDRLWPLPWYLIPATGIAWAVLRARYKHALHQQSLEEGIPADFDQIA
ncbi:hypothetical protein ABZT48_10775 [Streptomyces avermitilis]|uniref:hypothetical protein n=1 Tax=Streptomyces avermitilis TaxID=33903 RepID=UPI0033A21FF0